MSSIALRALVAVQAIFVLVLSSGLLAQSPQGLVKSAKDGADLYGFTAQFQKRLDALGEISVDEFLERYERPEQYVDSLSYDPVSDEFLNSFTAGAGRPPRTDAWGSSIAPIKTGLELNDEEREVLGKEKLRNDGQPPEPERAQGHRFRGKVDAPSAVTDFQGGPGPVFPPPPVLNLPKTIDYQVLENGRFEVRWPLGTTHWRSRELGSSRRFVVVANRVSEGLNIRTLATTGAQFFFWLE